MRVGLAVSAKAVRAIAARGGRVLWALESDVLDGEPLAASIAALLEAAPIPRWPRPAVTVAFGGTYAQIKPLAGLPPVKDRAVLIRAARGSTERFFLGAPDRLVGAGVRVDADGCVWAAALDRSAVDAVRVACASRGVTIGAIVPALAVVPAAIDGDRIVWEDDGRVTDISVRAGQAIALTRLPASNRRAMKDSTPRIVPALAAVGSDAVRYAAAFGAAVAGHREPLGLKSGEENPAASFAAVPRWRMAAAGLAVMVSGAAVLAAPGLAASRVAAQARSELAPLASPRRAALVVQKQIAGKTAVLTSLSEFSARRQQSLALLADVTRLLPPDAVMVAFRIDSAGGTIVALAPRATAIVSRLERSTLLAAPELVGPVTREVVASREYERVTVRFRSVSGARIGTTLVPPVGAPE